jgi:hypothetical protein
MENEQMPDQMSTENAIAVIKEVSAAHKGNLAAHQTIQTAIQVIEKALTPEPETETPTPPTAE